MKHEVYVLEAAKLSAKSADGSYPVVIITEGVGSTGVYRAELMRDDQAQLFENAASFMDHPVDPQKPHLRSVLSIGGRIRNVRAGESEGKRALLGDYFPRKEYAEFVEEFADTVGLSIFSLAEGEETDEQGRLIVENFAPNDPYRSVDIVVAPGRGGKFQRARESARAIESSLGVPVGVQPGAAPAPGSTQQEEEDMDPKVLSAALAEALQPVLTLLGEQKVAIEALKAGAPAPAAAPEVKDADEARKGAIEALAAIEDAKIVSKTAREALVADVAAGKDITAALEFVKNVQAENAPSPTSGDIGTYVAESAGGAAGHDWSVSGFAGGAL